MDETIRGVQPDCCVDRLRTTSVGRTRAQGAQVMKREWSYAELVDLFPELASVRSGAACVAQLVGRGKYIKTTPDGRSHYGSVRLSARPSESLAVRLSHNWPSSLPASTEEDLDHALLRGIVEAIVREDPPPFGCCITTDEVEYQADRTTTMAVQIAASMSLMDLSRKAGWEGGDPAPDVA